ncbi:uncharacterized protein [Ptychodera flava]|uniref:uncharacterized protein n=1 Tax=Ptychodera flava TaxID=63121 RepID=UPI00396A64D3
MAARKAREQAMTSHHRSEFPSKSVQLPRPNWLMMRTLPDEPENLNTFKPDPREDKSMEKYTKMWKHFRASQYKSGEVPQSGFFKAVRESGSVNDDYIHPVSTLDGVPQLPKVDYDYQLPEIDYDDQLPRADYNDEEDYPQGRTQSYFLSNQSWQ